MPKSNLVATASAIVFTFLPVVVIILLLTLGANPSSNPNNPPAAPHVLHEVPGQGTLNVSRLDADGLQIIEALNVPFALPPVGPLRFKPPQPNPKGWTGVRNATAFGPGCMQRAPKFAVSEDCLQLNIWAPNITNSTSAALPVYVWVFGGGLTSGSGITYNGSALAALGGMVVVSINYRVGAIGFYASEFIRQENPDEPTNGAMNGVLDVVMALKWIQKYIHAFGGDPSRVTVGGESSGSVSTCILSFSPIAKDLFKQVVLESGVCSGPWFGPATLKDSYNVSHSYADDLEIDYNSPDSLSHLRAIPAADLVKATHFIDPNYGVDGYVLTAAPHDTKSNLPSVRDSAIFLGGNSMDSTCVSSTSPAPPPTYAGLNSTLWKYFANDTEEVMSMYSANPDTLEAGRLWLRMNRDAGVICPALWLARRLSNQGVPVYLYFFGYNPTNIDGIVDHGGELDLMFQRNSPNANAKKVSASMGSYLATFVHGQRSTLIGSDEWPQWPQFKNDSELLLVVGPDPFAGIRTSVAMGQAAVCSGWERYVSLGAQQLLRFNQFGYLC